MTTLPQQFFITAQKYPAKVALQYKQGGAYLALSFLEVEKKIKTVASALVNLGLKPQDRVALLAPNCPEWVMADLGIMLAGGVVVPVHTTFSPRLISGVLQNSGSQILLVATTEQAHKIVLIAKELPQLKKIIYLQADNLAELPAAKTMSWSDFLALGQKETILPTIKDQDVCSIIYTSGTIGEPKGVVLTHQNFFTNAFACHQVIPVTEQDVVLSFLPLSHVFERTAGYYAPLLMAGATIAYAESTKELAKNLREVNPTIIITVPRVLEKMHDAIWQKIQRRGQLVLKLFHWALKQRRGSFGYWVAEILIIKKVRQALGNRFRFTISGGSALSWRMAKFFAKLGITIYEGYGLTETSPVITTNHPQAHKEWTVGQVLPGVQIKINPDKEILVQGPNLMFGYWQNEAATKEIINSNGWLQTGDLGHLDQEGYLTIIGRKREMIVTAGGKNIWPEILEEKLNETKYITQSMVVGDRCKHLVALVVPNWLNLQAFLQNQKISSSPEQALQHPAVFKLYRQAIDVVTEHLADYEKIIKFVLITNEFTQEREELTPTLKLRRSMIATHYQREIEKMYLG